MSRLERFTRSALLVGLLGALWACAPFSTPRDVDGGGCLDDPCITQRDDLARLLRYAEQVGRMSEPARRRQHALAEQAFAREASAFNRLRLALLLALPDSPLQCDSCARDLLRDYLQPDDNDRAWRNFATLLLHATEQRLALQQALETERRQHQLAREQVEKLKAIEQRINERDRAAITEPKQTP